jgi:hypothetical protein
MCRDRRLIWERLETSANAIERPECADRTVAATVALGEELNGLPEAPPAAVLSKRSAERKVCAGAKLLGLFPTMGIRTP